MAIFYQTGRSSKWDPRTSEESECRGKSQTTLGATTEWEVSILAPHMTSTLFISYSTRNLLPTIHLNLGCWMNSNIKSIRTTKTSCKDLKNSKGWVAHDLNDGKGNIWLLLLLLHNNVVQVESDIQKINQVTKTMNEFDETFRNITTEMEKVLATEIQTRYFRKRFRKLKLKHILEVCISSCRRYQGNMLQSQIQQCNDNLKVGIVALQGKNGINGQSNWKADAVKVKDIRKRSCFIFDLWQDQLMLTQNFKMTKDAADWWGSSWRRAAGFGETDSTAETTNGIENDTERRIIKTKQVWQIYRNKSGNRKSEWWTENGWSATTDNYATQPLWWCLDVEFIEHNMSFLQNAVQIAPSGDQSVTSDDEKVRKVCMLELLKDGIQEFCLVLQKYKIVGDSKDQELDYITFTQEKLKRQVNELQIDVNHLKDKQVICCSRFSYAVVVQRLATLPERFSLSFLALEWRLGRKFIKYGSQSNCKDRCRNTR